MSNLRSVEAQQFAEMFKALSNPNRLSIFLRLASCCVPGTTCDTDAEVCECVGKLGKDLGIAPSTISHHIKELRQAGLIRMERHGQNVECRVDPETLNSLAMFFNQPVSI